MEIVLGTKLGPAQSVMSLLRPMTGPKIHALTSMLQVKFIARPGRKRLMESVSKIHTIMVCNVRSGRFSSVISASLLHLPLRSSPVIQPMKCFTSSRLPCSIYSQSTSRTGNILMISILKKFLPNSSKQTPQLLTQQTPLSSKANTTQRSTT